MITNRTTELYHIKPTLFVTAVFYFSKISAIRLAHAVADGCLYRIITTSCAVPRQAPELRDTRLSLPLPTSCAVPQQAVLQCPSPTCESSSRPWLRYIHRHLLPLTALGLVASYGWKVLHSFHGTRLPQLNHILDRPGLAYFDRDRKSVV